LGWEDLGAGQLERGYSRPRTPITPGVIRYTPGSLELALSSSHPRFARRIVVRPPRAFRFRRSPPILYPDGGYSAIRPRCAVIARASNVQSLLVTRFAIEPAQCARSEVENNLVSQLHLCSSAASDSVWSSPNFTNGQTVVPKRKLEGMTPIQQQVKSQAQIRALSLATQKAGDRSLNCGRTSPPPTQSRSRRTATSLALPADAAPRTAP
jgi:hypothetical protein